MKKLLGFFCVGFLLSCQPEVPEPVEEDNGSMSCTLNGETWIATSLNNTFVLDYENDWGVNGKRLDLRGTADGLQIIITCGNTTNPAEESLNTGMYETLNSTNEGLVTVMSGWNMEGITTGDEDDNALITLSSINTETNTCSGTFTFSTNDFSTDSTNYEAVNGMFTDLVYTVQ
jgi:hypothetical protein